MPSHLTNYEHTPVAVPATYPTIHIAVISCGKDKRPHPAPARDLYTGHLFVDARAYIEAAVDAGLYTTYRILSARHGLLDPNEIVGPYEATMDTKTVDDLHIWVNKVDSQARGSGLRLGLFSQWGGRVVLDLYPAAAYVEPLLKQWAALSWEINTPHEGLQLGERRRAYRAALTELAGGRTGR